MDFNGDGKLDLAVPSNVFGTGNVLQVYFGNGDGTFQSATDSPASQDFIGVVAADVNGNGDGTFRAPIQIQAGVLAVAPTFFGLAVGDSTTMESSTSPSAARIGTLSVFAKV